VSLERANKLKANKFQNERKTKLSKKNEISVQVTIEKVVAKIESTLNRKLEPMEKALVEFTTQQLELDLLDY